MIIWWLRKLSYNSRREYGLYCGHSVKKPPINQSIRPTMSAINQIMTINLMYLSKNIAVVGVTWSWHQCHGCDENWKYCAWSRNRTHISCILDQCATITSCRLPDVTTIPVYYLCSSLLQRSVQTINSTDSKLSDLGYVHTEHGRPLTFSVGT